METLLIEIAKAYPTDALTAGISVACLPFNLEKKPSEAYYASIVRYFNRNATERLVVAKAYGSNVAEAINNVATNWRSILKQLAQQEAEAKAKVRENANA